MTVTDTIATDLTFAPVAGHIGADVRGVDLREPLNPSQAQAITDGLHRQGPVLP